MHPWWLILAPARTASTALVLLLLFLNGAIRKRPVLLLLTGNRTTGMVVGWKQDGTVKAPIVEFVAKAGVRVRVTGLVSTAKHSVREGDKVAVFFRASDTQSPQILLLNEFRASADFLGIMGFMVVVWMVAILMSGDAGFGDPLRLLPRLLDQLHLNPVRDPQLFILFLVIPGCGLASRALFREAVEMRTQGIRVVGQVTKFSSGFSRLADGRLASGSFPMIAYDDSSESMHTIRRSAAWPLARLHVGDAVEVIYLARRPEKGIVDTWDELYLVPVFFGVMMLGFLGILVGVFKGPYG